MRISVNLATRPFVELRPFFLRLRIVMASLAVVAVALAIAAHALQTRVDTQQAQLDRVKAQTFGVQQERARNERRMQQPQNSEVLARAHFLNALFLHKSFSWTAVMMDLETVLPVGVQVTSIEPQVSADGVVGIRLRVGGDRDRAVVLLRNLEHSRRFLQPRLFTEVSQAKEGQQGTGATAAVANGSPAAVPPVEFDILATYNPLPEGVAYPKPKAQPSAGSSSQRTIQPAVPGQPAFDSSGRHGVVLQPYQATHPSPATLTGGPARPVGPTRPSAQAGRQP